MRKLFIVSAFLGLFNESELKAQSTDSKKNGVNLEVSYIGDNVNNFSGGSKKGSVYLGMANVKLLIDSEEAGLWRGSQFYVNAVNTHGATPSADYLCDNQIASNIEAGDHTYIQELWIKQSIGDFEFTLGLQDLNVEFATSENASLFLNSSFGILPSISANIPAPIFPLTNLGFTAKWKLSDHSAWLFAIYDGQPGDFENNPYNLSWQFSSEDGLLAITEIQYNTHIEGHQGSYKFGVFNRHFTTDFTAESTFGMYMYADQELWRKDDQSFGLFVHLGYSPSENSANTSYLGMGANFTGLLSQSRTDILGLAIAHSNYKTIDCDETTIELSWKKQITDNFFIQPDVQYIMNSSIEFHHATHCLAGILRFGLSF